MSSTFGGGNFTKPADFRLVRYPVAAGQVISIGDFLYWDSSSSTVKPLSAITGSGTAATDQTNVHDTFVGVAVQARIAAQITAGFIEVITECTYEADCASSSALLPGDMVGAVSSGAAAAGAIQDQKVVEVSDAAKAIGVVVAYYSSATTRVLCRIYGLAARQKF
jgi:hypothetical protein